MIRSKTGLIFAALALCLFGSNGWGATLYVTEVTSAPPTVVIYQAARMPAIVNQTVAIGASSAQSAAFNVSTGLIRVATDVACHVLIGGTNPTALLTSMRLAAGQTEYFVVVPGDKIAVIAE